MRVLETTKIGANELMLYTSPWSRFEITTSVVVGTDCIGSYKSNYHTITAMTARIDDIGVKHQYPLHWNRLLLFVGTNFRGF
jgi:hypothetical protein